MTPQELAKQITNDYAPTIENLDAKIVIYDAVMEMHEWTKQQLIDKACKWLLVNDSYAIPTNVQVDRLREHLSNIK